MLTQDFFEMRTWTSTETLCVLKLLEEQKKGTAEDFLINKRPEYTYKI